MTNRKSIQNHEMKTIFINLHFLKENEEKRTGKKTEYKREIRFYYSFHF